MRPASPAWRATRTVPRQHTEGSGDPVCLTNRQFNQIMENSIDTSDPVPFGGSDDLTAKIVCTFKSSWDFCDCCDANPQPAGARTKENEVATGVLGAIEGTPYDIAYPCRGRR